MKREEIEYLREEVARLRAELRALVLWVEAIVFPHCRRNRQPVPTGITVKFK